MFHLFILLLLLFFDNPNDDIKTHYLRSDKILVSMYHKKHVQFCWLLQYSKQCHLFSNDLESNPVLLHDSGHVEWFDLFCSELGCSVHELVVRRDGWLRPFLDYFYLLEKKKSYV